MGGQQLHEEGGHQLRRQGQQVRALQGFQGHDVELSRLRGSAVELRGRVEPQLQRLRPVSPNSSSHPCLQLLGRSSDNLQPLRRIWSSWIYLPCGLQYLWGRIRRWILQRMVISDSIVIILRIFI